MTTRPDDPAPGALSGDGRAEAALEAAFAAARAARPQPGAALIARILADAEAEAARRAAPRGPAGVLAAFYRALGGAPAAASLGLAAAAGLWIGISPPALLQGVSAAVWAAPADIDFAPALGEAGIEGLEDADVGGTDA